MSNLKSIGNKLFKTELATHKVELGIMQDFLAEYKQVVDKYTSAQSSLDRAIEQAKELKKTYNKLESQAKELGLDLGNDVKKLGSNLDSFTK